MEELIDFGVCLAINFVTLCILCRSVFSAWEKSKAGFFIELSKGCVLGFGGCVIKLVRKMYLYSTFHG